MKTQSILLTIAFVCTLGNLSIAQTAKKDTIKVWGNCGMCKKTIETAATKAGASTADWNTDTKILSVSYNAKKSNAQKIQQAIAAAGYDTKDLTAPEEAYNNLHACCQYDRKANESAAVSKDD
ncbi:MAG: copper chaperone, partial [Chitinophagaceae bacterium]|nr:copper chaperone [Chitinophagaceae bacterium]